MPRRLAITTLAALFVAGGAPAAETPWSFRPVRPVPPPRVKAVEWVKSPVDRFILAKLEESGLSPSPPAEPRALIRRVTFDLIGLPPTPEEVEEFLREWSAKPQA